MADWSNATTIKQFYYKLVLSTNLGRSVLDYLIEQDYFVFRQVCSFVFQQANKVHSCRGICSVKLHHLYSHIFRPELTKYNPSYTRVDVAWQYNWGYMSERKKKCMIHYSKTRPYTFAQC